MVRYKIQTGLRLNETMYEKARILASKEHRSLNNLIEHILQKYIDDYESKNGEILIEEED